MQRNGLLLIDKHPGCTSHDVVQSARRLLKQRKIGHCGTLDPDATGLLLLTLGKATRLTRFLISAPKVYTGIARLGIATDTYDASGQVTATRSTAKITAADVDAALRTFEGELEQAAPPFSAKKFGGVKYYEMARRGDAVPTARKPITVFEFRLIGDLVGDTIPFRLACSSGTYVRSLAHELGEALGCGAHLETLRRQQVGPFSVESAATLAELEEALGSDVEELASAWVPFDAIPLPFAEMAVDAQHERRIVHGQTVLSRGVEVAEGDWLKLVNARGQLVAVGSVIEIIGEQGVGVVRPRIVFR